MSKLILEIDGMQLNKKMYDANLYDTFSAIVYNQKPFLREGMTVGEFLEERKYLGEHYQEFLDGSYEPLWRKCEKK